MYFMKIMAAVFVVCVLGATSPAWACHNPEQHDPCEGAPAATEYTDRSAARDAHEPSIDCITYRGVAVGFTDDDGRREYRPAALVRRDQMATFLVNVIVAAGWGDRLPPEGAAARFSDVGESNPHRDNINRLAEAGVVRGVDDDRYNPAGSVSRQQMATFIVGAVRLALGDHHPVVRDDDDRFSDVSRDNVHKDAIEAGADHGLFRGSTATTYTPGAPVRRDQMASYLTAMLRDTYDSQGSRPRFVHVQDRTVRAGEEVTGSIDGADIHSASATGCGASGELSDQDTHEDGWQFSFRIPSDQPPGECEVVFRFDATYRCRRGVWEDNVVITVER